MVDAMVHGRVARWNVQRKRDRAGFPRQDSCRAGKSHPRDEGRGHRLETEGACKAHAAARPVPPESAAIGGRLVCARRIGLSPGALAEGSAGGTRWRRPGVAARAPGSGPGGGREQGREIGRVPRTGGIPSGNELAQWRQGGAGGAGRFPGGRIRHGECHRVTSGCALQGWTCCAAATRAARAAPVRTAPARQRPGVGQGGARS